MSLAGAAGSEEQDVGAPIEPGVTLGKRHDVSLAERRHGREVEGRERLAGWQSRFGEVAGDAPAMTLVDLVFAQGRQEPGRSPAFPVGTLAEILPKTRDGGQAKRGEHHRQLGDIGGSHGVSGAVKTGSRLS